MVRNLSFKRLEYLSAGKRNCGGEVLLSELEDCIPDECRDAQQHLEARELAQSLNGFLATLTPGDRQLFLSRYYYAMTAPQLGEKYGGSPRQIKYRLQKLRGELKAHLEKEGIYV